MHFQNLIEAELQNFYKLHDSGSLILQSIDRTTACGFTRNGERVFTLSSQKRRNPQTYSIVSWIVGRLSVAKKDSLPS
ncbi:hypothetical protein H6P81_016493 [Aristolochia fimbriata]|uniref:Uncharacterized protein n=1 Tax=Aristolochia fimbriata TaxID=158543 RepID=A0AAV7E8W3_ARIFI|nr:hypothetical protein H6P81_016493 [Aristolochia fimbriata]